MIQWVIRAFALVAGVTLASISLTTAGHTAEINLPCKGKHEPASDAAVERRLEVAMLLANYLEKQGRDNPDPDYAPMSEKCLGGSRSDLDFLTVIHRGKLDKTKPEHLVLTIWAVNGKWTREILGIYNAPITLSQKQGEESAWIAITETVGTLTVFHEIYQSVPTSEQLLALGFAIAEGEAKPLFLTEWEEGLPKMSFPMIDKERLK